MRYNSLHEYKSLRYHHRLHKILKTFKILIYAAMCLLLFFSFSIPFGSRPLHDLSRIRSWSQRDSGFFPKNLSRPRRRTFTGPRMMLAQVNKPNAVCAILLAASRQLSVTFEGKKQNYCQSGQTLHIIPRLSRIVAPQVWPYKLFLGIRKGWANLGGDRTRCGVLFFSALL